MLISNRHKRHIKLARRVAHQSDFHEYRHGAVLVKGNRVLNTSANKNSYKLWDFGTVIVDMPPIMQSLVVSLASIEP